MDKLQRAGRDFLMRLVMQHGLRGTARVLRALAYELEAALRSVDVRRCLAALTCCCIHACPNQRNEPAEHGPT
jgi:hypothetical protein